VGSYLVDINIVVLMDNTIMLNQEVLIKLEINYVVIIKQVVVVHIIIELEVEHTLEEAFNIMVDIVNIVASTLAIPVGGNRLEGPYLGQGYLVAFDKLDTAYMALVGIKGHVQMFMLPIQQHAINNFRIWFPNYKRNKVIRNIYRT
jgi:hypothetical protein